MWSILASLGLAILLFALRLMGAHYAWVELRPGPFTSSIIGLFVIVQIYLELACETSSELVLRVLRCLAGLC